MNKQVKLFPLKIWYAARSRELREQYEEAKERILEGEEVDPPQPLPAITSWGVDLSNTQKALIIVLVAGIVSLIGYLIGLFS